VKNLLITYFVGERYESIIQAGYKSLGIIFCFDLSNNDLNSLTRFTDELEKYGGVITKSNTVLVGLKSDMDRAVTAQEIKDFCIKHNFTSYYEVSSKTGANVEEFFTEYVTSILQRNHFCALGKPDNLPSDKLLQNKLHLRWLPSFIKI